MFLYFSDESYQISIKKRLQSNKKNFNLSGLCFLKFSVKMFLNDMDDILHFDNLKSVKDEAGQD